MTLSIGELIRHMSSLRPWEVNTLRITVDLLIDNLHKTSVRDWGHPLGRRAVC